MVMHARKYQRLNDGYYEREQTHPYEEKNPSKHRHYNDHYTDNQRQSPNFHCMGGMSDSRSHTSVDESSLPRSGERYQNKASYIERNKEKPEKDKVMDKHQYHDRVHKVGKEGRNREQKERDHRAEVRKSAVRVCGDWSEHISSSGKCYYYNCKTEVSRWEKPKEWVDKLADVNKTLPPKNKDVRERRQQHGHPIKKYEDRQKHSVSATATSSSSNFHQQSNSRTLSSFGSPAPVRHQPHEHAGNCTQVHKYKQSQGPPASGPNNATNSNNSQNNKSGHAGHRTAGPPHVNTWQGHDHIKRDGGRVPPVDRTYSAPERPNKSYENRGNCDGSVSGTQHLSQTSRTIVSVSDYNGAKHERNDYEDSQQAEDMDISPGSTPTEESMMERHALIMANTGSTPISAVTSTPPSTSKHSPSTPNILSVLSHLTSSSLPDLPALASLSSLTAMSPGGSGGSPGSLLPQLLQQLATGGRTMPNAQGVHQPNQQVLQQAIQVLQQLQQTLLMQQKQQQQRQLQQLLVTQLHQLQQQLQHQQQQQPPNKHHQDVSTVQQQQMPQHLQQPQQQLQQQPQQTNRLPVEDGSQSPYSPPDESDGTPLQSPEHNPVTVGTTHQHSGHLDKTRQSPASEHSLISSRRASPAPSHTSSQNMSSLAASQLTAAHRKNDSAHLSSALAHYYDENLIGHVAGLIYDHTEKQADMVAEEAHTVGSILCTQVSADLKGARSLVRAGEIISTLYEQRLLFIRQQIKDLDNWRTQNTFMPSLSASSNRQGGDT